MSRFSAPLVLVWRRVRANWKFLLVLFGGVLLASTLLASSPLYLGAIKELGLRHALEFERRGALDAAVAVPFRPLDPSGYERVRSIVESRGEEALSDLVNERVAVVRTPPLDLRLPETGLIPGGSVFAGLQSYSGYEAHSRVVEGAFPRATHQTGESGPLIEAAIGRDSADAFRLKLHDLTVLTPSSSDPSRTVTARIVGILEPVDIGEQYWSFAINPFAPQVDSSSGQDVPLLPVIVAHDTFFQELASSFRGTLVTYWWFFYVDAGLIRADETDQIQASLAEMEALLSVEQPGSTLFTGLTSTLESFENKLFFSRIPILVVLILVILVVLYYLVMVANVVVDRHLTEIALLRSRGAAGAQVMGVYVWEALILSAVAFVLGPFLGRVLVPLLGKAPAFEAATGGELLPVELTLTAFIFSLAAAALSFLVLLIPALRGARFNLLNAKAIVARPSPVSFFHKYYLDLFLLALAGLLYWEMTQRGSLVTRKLFGGDSTDYLLLAAPAFFILGVSLAVLRFLPPVMLALSTLASRVGKVWLVIGLWTIARNPVHYMRPILLLTLVAALAMFAASFNRTVEQSFRDRGLYEAGSDVRLVGIPSPLTGPKEQLSNEFESRRGVTSAAPVYRVTTEGGGGVIRRAYNLLAIDTIKFHRVSFYRDDFSDRPLFNLLRHLDQGRSVVRGMELPEGTTGLGLWVRPSAKYGNMSLWFRVRNEEGQISRVRTDRLDFADWRMLRADFGGRSALQGPLVLEAIYLWEFDFPKEPFPTELLVHGHVSSGTVNLSGLTAFTGTTPAGTVIDSFAQPDSWRPLATSALSPEVLERSDSVSRNGQRVSRLTWQSSSGVGIRGMFPTDYEDAVPVVVSSSFLSATGRRVGEVVEVSVAGIPVPVRIADSVDFFPTMNPNRPFVLGNLDTLLHYANLFRGFRALPNEVWIALVDDQDVRDAFLRDLGSTPYGRYAVYNQDATLSTLERDPLVGSGSRGIVFTAMAVLVIVTVGGYLGYFYVSSFRTPLELAILRALGLSGGQLLSFQLLVHSSVIAAALALGTWVGARAHSIMITFLQHTERGREVLPPFAPHTDWSGFAVILLTSLGVLAVVAAWLAWSFARTPIWRVLRASEQ